MSKSTRREKTLFWLKNLIINIDVGDKDDKTYIYAIAIFNSVILNKKNSAREVYKKYVFKELFNLCYKYVFRCLYSIKDIKSAYFSRLINSFHDRYCVELVKKHLNLKLSYYKHDTIFYKKLFRLFKYKLSLYCESITLFKQKRYFYLVTFFLL